MYQTVNVYEFRDAFAAMGRKDQFSYDALGMLFEYFEDMAADEDGQGYELDVIAICCDFSESSVDEIIRDYGVTLDAENEDPEDYARDQVRAFLEDHTSIVGETDDGFVFAQF